MSMILPRTKIPYTIPGLVGFYECSDILGNNSTSFPAPGAISKWVDLSEFQNSVVQNTSQYQPAFQTNKVGPGNSLPIVYFNNAITAYMSGPNPKITNNFSFVWVGQSLASEIYAQYAFNVGVPFTNGFSYYRDTTSFSNARVITCGTSAVNFGTVSSNYEIITGVYNGTTLNAYLNGTSMASTSATFVAPTNTMNFADYAGNAWAGNFYALCLFNWALSATYITQMNRYFGNKLGISVP